MPARESPEPANPSDSVWESSDLATILDAAWTALERGKANARHPFHTPTLATLASSPGQTNHIDQDGAAIWPTTRTVVLRKVDRAGRRLFCHTDARSEKVTQLRSNPRAQWHFYDPTAKVQLRARTVATVHLASEDVQRSGIAWNHWQASRLSSRRGYAITAPPGSPLDAPGSALPPGWESRAPTLEESEAGWHHFAVVETRIDELTWLYLQAHGNRSARFTWPRIDTPWNQPTAAWIVP